MNTKADKTQLTNSGITFFLTAGLLTVYYIHSVEKILFDGNFALTVFCIAVIAATAGKLSSLLSFEKGLFPLCLSVLIITCPALPCFSEITGYPVSRLYYPFGLFCAGMLFLNEKTKWITALTSVLFSFSFLFPQSDFTESLYGKRYYYIFLISVILLLFSFGKSKTKSSLVCFIVTCAANASGLITGMIMNPDSTPVSRQTAEYILKNSVRLVPCAVFIFIFLKIFIGNVKDKNKLRLWLDVTLISAVSCLFAFSSFFSDGLALIIAVQLVFTVFVASEKESVISKIMSRKISGRPLFYAALIIINAVFVYFV